MENLELDILYEDYEYNVDEEQQNFSNYKRDIITTIAYLLGIKKQYLEKEDEIFVKEKIEELGKNNNANIIRNLSILRNDFLRNSKEIKARRNNLTPIDQMDDIIDIDAIKYLRKNNIEIIKPNIDTTTYIAYLNQYILENIDNIKEIIPTWIKWEYIKNIFLMPQCYAGHNGIQISNKDQLKRVISHINTTKKLIFDNKTFYPYGVYLYWPPTKMMSYYGNILFNDSKFLKILYSAYGDTFHAEHYVIDATKEDKDNIYEFIENSLNIAILVDCENVDPYRFVSVFKGLDEENLKKIKKVILYDDVNTSPAWDYINEIINLPIEHNEIERLLDNKSLVDVAMTAGACKEYYKANTESLILASSDSDFWALIQSLPDARFFVLNESDKTSEKILSELFNKNINSCFMDSFAQSEVQAFKNMVLLSNLKSKIEEFNETGFFEILDANELVDKIFAESYIQGSPYQIEQEKKAFFNKYLKKGLKITIQDNKFVMELNKK